MKTRSIVLSVLFMLIITSCTSTLDNTTKQQTNVSGSITEEHKPVKEILPMNLSSLAFQNGEIIPAKYTCSEEDINSPLLVKNIPDDAKSISLIMYDPDAPSGIWDHWIAFNIIPTNNKLDILEGNSNVGTSGKNSWSKTGYGGPCPPSGTHRYVFDAYALGSILNLPQGASKQQILAAMQGHIIAQSELVGIYGK